MKTKLIILTTILITLIVGITILFSYSYFNASVNTSNTAIVNTTLPNGSYTFTTSNSGTISYTFTANKMLASASSTTAVASDDANVSVSLKSPDANTVVVCTYDLIWEWTGTDQYTTSDTTLPLTSGSQTYNYEMSVKGTSATTGAPTSLPSVGASLAEKDLSKFNWIGTSGAVGYKAIIVRNASIASASTTPTVTNWDLTSSIYNIPVAQTNLQSKNFKAKIYVSVVNCNTNSKLPSGYTQVNYIQSSGTQYINTGVNPSSNTSMLVDAYLDSYPATYGTIVGSNNGTWSGLSYALYFGPTTWSNYNNDSNLGLGNLYGYRYVFNRNTTKLYMDGTLLRTDSGTFESTYPLYVFAMNWGGTLKYYIGAKLFKLTLYNNNTLVRDYIPAINSSSVAGLYDTVTNTFYTNAGTGTFTTG